MTPTMRILIATTNQGKYKEILHFLGDLPFEFLSLADLKKKIKEPIEKEATIEGNAILKAKYYSEKTGLITIAEDGGVFVDPLNGWPGVLSARIGKDPDDRTKKVLEKMKSVPNKKRTASFLVAIAIYDTTNQNTFVSLGETKGRVLGKAVKDKNGFGYDPIFYVPENKKTYSQMSVAEKNACSHRGKALQKIKYYLQNQFGAKHIVVPCALIIKDKKLLITLRNDPHRKETHKKWEVPGGIVDFDENIESTVIKEVQEEVGYKVKVIKQLQKIAVKDHKFPNFNYQVYLIPVVCKITGGKLKLNSNEVLDAKWIDPTTHRKYEFLKGDNEWLDQLMPELLETTKEYNL